ncbi:MAG: MgtC/SapB family protein [Candidatus Thorarchaeota archaeon]|nr:MgtC/SapB family protein [Candidatus Thorarchaeota archaeon]
MQELLLSPDLVVRSLIGFSVGALIGLERQKSLTEELTAGVRSFGLFSLLGTIAAYTYTVTGMPFVLIYAIAVSAILIGIHMAYKMFRTMRKGMTTSIVLALAFVLGTLVGLDTPPQPGQYIGPLSVLAMTSAFLVFLVLGFKEELAAAVAVVTREEMISAVELVVLIMFLWPLIPMEVVLGTVTVPSFQIYIMLIILLSVSFVNYILTKKFKERGPYFFGFFGGFANSEATVSSLTDFHIKTEMAYPGRIALGTILANVAMVLRNAIILLLLDPTYQLIKYYMIPLTILIIGAMVRLFMEQGKIRGVLEEDLEDALASPFEFGAALRFAAIFTVVSLFALFLQDMASDLGILFAAAIGGLVSAGAVVFTVAAYASTGLSLTTAVLAVVIATTTSVMNKMFYVSRDRDLLRTVARDSFLMAIGVMIFILLVLLGIVPIV